MSACISPTIRGGSTCWNGARPRRTPPRSTSTGTMLPYRAPRRRAAADHRLVLRRGAGERRDRAALRRRAKAAFRPGISSTGCRSRRSATARSCARSCSEADAADEPAGKAILDLAARYHGPAPSRPQGGARLQGRAEGHPRRRRRSSTRGLAAYRAGDGRPAQIQALHHLLERQHYKLGHWRLAVAARSTIAASSTSTRSPACASRTPAPSRRSITLVKRLIADGQLQGLRLDHIDGLRDPAQYFQRLRRLIARRAGRRPRTPFYMVIEKILGEGETLPRFAGVARHHRLRMAQRHHPGAGRRQRASRRSTRSGGRSATARRISRRC